MKSIITTYIPATNTKPARIKAKAEGVPAIVMSWGEAEHKAVSHDGHTGQDDIFKAVALAMCAKYNWPVDLVGGGLPDSIGHAWCFVPEEKAIISNNESVALDLRRLAADIDGGAFQRPSEMRVELLQLAGRIDGLGVYPKDSEKNRK